MWLIKYFTAKYKIINIENTYVSIIYLYIIILKVIIQWTVYLNDYYVPFEIFLYDNLFVPFSCVDYFLYNDEFGLFTGFNYPGLVGLNLNLIINI